MASRSPLSSLPGKQAKSRKLTRLLQDGTAKPAMANLSYEQLSLFDFLTLVVDIKYRDKYGKSIDRTSGRGYTRQTLKSEDRPTQLTPVERGLDGNTRRELSDARQQG